MTSNQKSEPSGARQPAEGSPTGTRGSAEQIRAKRSETAAGEGGANPKSRYVMIGGFLGAGKTTAVAAVAQHFAAQGLRVGLITNDQGSELVDTTIDKILEKQQAHAE